MADTTVDGSVKKVIIPSDQFINRNIINGNLVNFVRYRVITEDKTSVSAWSPIYMVKQPSMPSLIGTNLPTIKVSSNLDTVSITWNTPTDSSGNAVINIYSYDVYIKWYSGNTELTSGYQYVGSVNSQKNNTFSIVKPNSANKVSALVQASTYPKEVNVNAFIQETLLQNV